MTIAFASEHLLEVSPWRVGHHTELLGATHRLLGMEVAIKIDRFPTGHAAAEASLIRQLNHPGVIDLLEVANTPDGRTYFVMPRMRTDLAAVVCANQRLSQSAMILIASTVGSTLGYMHSRKFVHGDVSLGNILADSCSDPRRVHLADFDQTVAFTIPATPQTQARGLGTSPFTAPEVLRGEPPSGASDSFSYAMAMLQLLNMVLLPRWQFLAAVAVLNNSLHPDACRRQPVAELALNFTLAIV